MDQESACGGVPLVAPFVTIAGLFCPPLKGGSLPTAAPSPISPLQGDCGSPYFHTIYAVDTLCCPDGTCAEFLCVNVFCRTIFFGTYQCWQDLALCGMLYCSEPNDSIMAGGRSSDSLSTGTNPDEKTDARPEEH